MKRVISFFLAAVICLSLCACGGGISLTADEVEQALADCGGTLDMETSGKEVIKFTYVVEDVNSEYLIYRSYSRNALDSVLEGNMNEITIGEIKAAQAFAPLMCIDRLLSEENDSFDSDAYTEKLLDIVCDNKVEEYDGWIVYAEVDQINDSITIYAEKGSKPDIVEDDFVIVSSSEVIYAD